MTTLSPHLQRPHLEALLVAHAALDRTLLDACPRQRLSPACRAILDAVQRYPALCREPLDLVPALWDGDEYVQRLIQRVERLTVADLLFFSRETLVTLCAELPPLRRPRVAGPDAVRRAA